MHQLFGLDLTPLEASQPALGVEQERVILAIAVALERRDLSGEPHQPLAGPAVTVPVRIGVVAPVAVTTLTAALPAAGDDVPPVAVGGAVIRPSTGSWCPDLSAPGMLEIYVQVLATGSQLRAPRLGAWCDRSFG
jgi:hypothetical protein